MKRAKLEAIGRRVDRGACAELRLRGNHGQDVLRARLAGLRELEFQTAAVIRSHGGELDRSLAENQLLPEATIERPQGPCSLERVRVFAQRDQLTLDLPALLRTARSYFDATLDIQKRSDPAADGRDSVEVLLRSEEHGYEGLLAIRTRWTSEHDCADARDAERRGQAAGMASLAERCPTIWDVEPVGADSELARLNLCGILAAVALGPVLPDDGSTLYGVRGAMERVERLLKAR